jgi:phosphotransferase family enzyme
MINFRAALRKLRSESSRWLEPGHEVCGLNFVNLRPVRPVRHGSALNKTGRLVLCGELDGRKVKIYEAANEQHARFIGAVCAREDLRDCFPAMRGVLGRFLIVDWVENRASSSTPPAALATLLQRVHQTPVAELPIVGFDYWHDLVKPRFVRAAELLGILTLAESVIRRVSDAWGQSNQFLMHPDLTPANTVLSENRWQIVDNELLTIGGLPLLDLCNAVYPLRREAGQQFATTYLAGSTLQIEPDDKSTLNAGWFARIIGSQFAAGNVSAATQTINRYKLGKNILPVDLRVSTSGARLLS